MKIRDLLTRENGFTSTGWNTIDDYTGIGTDRRIKIDNGSGGTIDLHNYCENRCKEKCNIEPDYTLENEPHCCESEPFDQCTKCEVNHLYLAYYKLFLLEELMRKEEE